MTLKPRGRKRADRQPKAGKKKPRSSAGGGGDAFFESDAKRRGGRRGRQDDDIESLQSDEEVGEEVEDEDGGEGILEETADEKRVRVAKEHLERIRAIAKRVEEEEGDEEDEEEGREEREGKRDSLVAEILQKEQLEQSGRIRRFIASRVLSPESDDAFRLLVKHRQPVTAVALAEDDSRGFSASKDGVILHWDVESGKSEKYLWPSEDVLVSHYAKPPQNSKNRSKNTLSLAVSADGRYLASGGLDRHVHLWDTRTREHLQAFHGHRGPVSCLTFREGTSQLFSGSFDRTIKLWNVEDRTHMDNLFGHQSEILTIDCLRRERLLTVGRDRTMRLWKVPEESQLVFRAPASALECCCFINDNEFLSGSDDGSIELWSVMRKKPTHLIKNAHAPYFLFNESLYKEDKTTMHNDGNTENGCKKDDTYSAAHSWVSSVSVCRGSDLAASGAANGFVCLWAVENDSGGIRPLYRFPLAGFINSLAFPRSARFLVAGVGQEPRLGGWGRVSSARNGVAIHPITLKEENTTTVF